MNLLWLGSEKFGRFVENLFLALFDEYCEELMNMWFWFLMQMVVGRVDSHPLILNVKLVIIELVRGIMFGGLNCKILAKMGSWMQAC